jgi:hypothetical protein
MSNQVLDRAFRVEEADGVARYRAVVFGTTDGGCRYPAAANAAGVLGITTHAQTRENRSVAVRRIGIALAEAAGAIAKGARIIVADATGRIAEASRARLETGSAGANNGVVFTAREYGAAGNLSSVELVATGTSQSLAVSVSGNAVSVQLATDGGGSATTTAAELIAAVNAHAAAGLLVEAAHLSGSDGSGVPAGVSATNLSGGEAGVNAFAEAQEAATAAGDVIEVLLR